jgi:hypothetical protein
MVGAAAVLCTGEEAGSVGIGLAVSANGEASLSGSLWRSARVSTPVTAWQASSSTGKSKKRIQRLDIINNTKTRRQWNAALLKQL